MCEYCSNVRLSQCRVVVEGKTGIRDINGKLGLIPCYSEILLPLNYCPNCGRKLGEVEGK